MAEDCSLHTVTVPNCKFELAQDNSLYDVTVSSSVRMNRLKTAAYTL